MRFGSSARVLAKCKLAYYRISECWAPQEEQGSVLEENEREMRPSTAFSITGPPHRVQAKFACRLRRPRLVVSSVQD